MNQKLKLSIISFFVIAFSFNAFSSTEHNPFFEKNWTSLATIQTNDIRATFKDLTELDVDIAGVNYNDNTVDALLGEFDFKLLLQKGMSVSIKETKGITAAPDKEYKDPSEIEDIITGFASNYPHLTEKVSLGKSLEGRDIWAIKISDNAELNELDEPTLLFNSMHHAREVMTPEVSIDIIEYLLTNYELDSKVKNWVDLNQIWVIPMFNVDGNVKMWNHDKWWRKNVRGGYGVDLNRNYPTGWNKCNGSSGRKTSQTYRGPSPASEPETKVMMDFIEKTRPVFDISYHAYSELVIYPFGCDGERTPTKTVVEKIGIEIATKLEYKPGTAWDLLYSVDGGDIDWMYDAFQVIPYVIEVSSSRQGFQPSYSKWRDKTVERNRAGWMHLLDRVQESGVRGQIMSSGTSVENAIVKVFNVSEQDILFQKYKAHQNGLYHLVLNPGTYKLEVHVDGNLEAEQVVTVKKNLVIQNIEL